MDNIILEKQITNTFSKLSPDCIAVYRGGSRVDPIIDHPHDYDYICFAAPLHRHFLLNKLYKLGFRKVASNNKYRSKGDNLVDLSQTRVPPYSRITWFSYLDVLMQKVIGEDACPQTDVIYEHRQEFFNLKSWISCIVLSLISSQPSAKSCRIFISSFCSGETS